MSEAKKKVPRAERSPVDRELAAMTKIWNQLRPFPIPDRRRILTYLQDRLEEEAGLARPCRDPDETDLSGPEEESTES